MALHSSPIRANTWFSRKDKGVERNGAATGMGDDDEKYRACLERVRSEIKELRGEAEELSQRLTYLRDRKHKLQRAIKAIQSFLEAEGMQ